MSKSLPSRPNLDHLRDQAKSLLNDYRRGESAAIARFENNLPGFIGASVALHDAQSVVAREYDFPSWPKLVAHVEEVRAREGITASIESEFVDTLLADDPARVRRLLELYPSLPRYSPACALVSAELDLVGEISPADKLGPRDLTPLEYVAYSRIHTILPDRYAAQTECAKSLLDRGADANAYIVWEGGGHIPVLYGAAAESGHLEIVKLLLAHGANPNDGESVYHSAEKGRLDILEVLRENGAQLEPPEEPLGYLAYYRDLYGGAEAMRIGTKWLLEHGASPNIRRGDRQETPLHIACRYANRSDLANMLLDHGADATILDRDGNSPYQLAVATDNQVALRALEAHGVHEEPSVENAFLAACTRNDIPAIRKALAENPAMVKQAIARSFELAAFFAQTSQTDGLLGLLTAGLPVDTKETHTLLHWASIEGQPEAVQVLIAHGAPLDLRDDEHHSPPLGWACWGAIFRHNPGMNHVAVIHQLIAAGSSVEDARAQLKNPHNSPEILDAIRESLELR